MTHRKEIQEALNYIERNLCRELSLDDIASAAGFSKFYFHRIFQKETGMSVFDYIRKRRLAGGALLLRTTDKMCIRDSICVHRHFQEVKGRSDFPWRSLT